DRAVLIYASRITIRSDELERMLEEAAQRADAAVWRRALASVAMDELEIALGEALEHPAVIRAQEIVGAPALDRAVFSATPAPEGQAQPHEPLLPPEAPPEAEAGVVVVPEPATGVAAPEPEAPPEPAALPELEAVP